MNYIYLIYGITKDDGNVSDLDAAIDRYYYHRCNMNGGYLDSSSCARQWLVNSVEGGSLAYTYPNGHVGTRCEVATSSNGIKYLKTVPDGNPKNNISALPEMQ